MALSYPKDTRVWSNNTLDKVLPKIIKHLITTGKNAGKNPEEYASLRSAIQKLLSDPQPYSATTDIFSEEGSAMIKIFKDTENRVVPAPTYTNMGLDAGKNKRTVFRASNKTGGDARLNELRQMMLEALVIFLRDKTLFQRNEADQTPIFSSIKEAIYIPGQPGRLPYISDFTTYREKHKTVLYALASVAQLYNDDFPANVNQEKYTFAQKYLMNKDSNVLIHKAFEIFPAIKECFRKLIGIFKYDTVRQFKAARAGLEWNGNLVAGDVQNAANELVAGRPYPPLDKTDAIDNLVKSALADWDSPVIPLNIDEDKAGKVEQVVDNIIKMTPHQIRYYMANLTSTYMQVCVAAHTSNRAQRQPGAVDPAPDQKNLFNTMTALLKVLPIKASRPCVITDNNAGFVNVFRASGLQALTRAAKLRDLNAALSPHVASDANLSAIFPSILPLFNSPATATVSAQALADLRRDGKQYFADASVDAAAGAADALGNNDGAALGGRAALLGDPVAPAPGPDADWYRKTCVGSIHKGRGAAGAVVAAAGVGEVGNLFLDAFVDSLTIDHNATGPAGAPGVPPAGYSGKIDQLLNRVLILGTPALSPDSKLRLTIETGGRAEVAIRNVNANAAGGATKIFNVPDSTQSLLNYTRLAYSNAFLDMHDYEKYQPSIANMRHLVKGVILEKFGYAVGPPFFGGVVPEKLRYAIVENNIRVLNVLNRKIDVKKAEYYTALRGGAAGRVQGSNAALQSLERDFTEVFTNMQNMYQGWVGGGVDISTVGNTQAKLNLRLASRTAPGLAAGVAAGRRAVVAAAAGGAVAPPAAGPQGPGLSEIYPATGVGPGAGISPGRRNSRRNRRNNRRNTRR